MNRISDATSGVQPTSTSRHARGMKKRISSPFTFFFKIVTPSLWAGLGIFALCRALFEPYTGQLFATVLFLIVWTAAPLLTNYWNNLPLKKVSIDNESLYVSNYIKEIRIPLSSVDDVKASAYPWLGWWRWPPYRVVIMLEDYSEFGNKILIIPGFYYKDVVHELRNALAANRSTR
jgi:hypothetical protein